MSPTYVWKLDVEYPERAHYRGWEPKDWHPTDEYLHQFKTDEFIWPSVQRFYASRSSAVNRANLLESYGAKVRLLRSAPLTFEERPFKRPLRVIQGGVA
jgi:hypothetical protein